jgi:protein arginine N-methyltransferase 1
MKTFDDICRQGIFDEMPLHEEMLADSVKMNAYQAAIQCYVTPNDDVVDVGTGTGILAFLAARKSSGKIYAIDRSKEILKYAKSVAKANNITNVIFKSINSRKFNKPVDVIIHDQMGIALFDEGMVETILDVRDRCLKPGGRILPAKFELYLEPVRLIKQERIPFIDEQTLYGLVFPPAKVYRLREVYPRDIDLMLCDPEPVFSFDLNTLTRDQIPKKQVIKKPIIRNGQMDGVCMYFKVIFEDCFAFSTGPFHPKTHWPMLLYRTPATFYTIGKTFQMNFEDFFS